MGKHQNTLSLDWKVF